MSSPAFAPARPAPARSTPAWPRATRAASIAAGAKPAIMATVGPRISRNSANAEAGLTYAINTRRGVVDKRLAKGAVSIIKNVTRYVLKPFFCPCIG